MSRENTDTSTPVHADCSTSLTDAVQRLQYADADTLYRVLCHVCVEISLAESTHRYEIEKAADSRSWSLAAKHNDMAHRMMRLGQEVSRIVLGEKVT